MIDSMGDKVSIVIGLGKGFWEWALVVLLFMIKKCS